MNLKIAERLATLRKEKGLSQEELADKLNISRQAVSKWERGESSPEIDNLICLSKLYGVTIDEIVNEDSKKHIVSLTMNKDRSFKSSLVTGICLLLAVIALFLVGEFVDNGYLWSWTFMLLALVIGSIFECFEKKEVGAFSYVLFVTFIYCFVCLAIKPIWHPLWVVFLTIPVFYTIADGIDKAKKNK